MSLMSIGFVLSNTPVHTLWVGCFVVLGEALALLFRLRETVKDAYQWKFFYLYGIILRGTLRAFFYSALLYTVKEIGSMRCILLCSAFTLEMSYIRDGILKRQAFFALLIICSILLIFWSSLHEISVNFYVLVFNILSLSLSTLAINISESVYSNVHNSWLGIFERVVASIELAFCSWLGTSNKNTLTSPYPWIIFPVISLLSGCGKSLYDSRFRETVIPASMIGILIFYIFTGILNIRYREIEGGDFFALISGVIILIASFKSLKSEFLLPSMETSVPFAQTRKKSSGFIVNAIKYLTLNERERKLLIYLLLTMGVMLLELIYGIVANSLGLISDAFHMMLDSASIAIGLFAAFASSLPCEKKTHPFGYARYEVLGGFINAVLLLFVALYVVLESVERLFCPPEIDAPYLIHVSVIGLLVNIVGVVFFHEAHGHSHSHGGCSHPVDHNLRGVYLHILADLLGSVSVMISSILIAVTGLRIADPLCSVLSSAFIAISAFPLLQETGKVLLLSGEPYDQEKFFNNTVRSIKKIPGVNTVGSLCAWTHSTAPRELTCCAVRVSAQSGVSHQTVRRLVKQCLRNILSAETGAHRIRVFVHIE
ncbi:putative cation transporter protein [Trypanosoma theileri]|uniref:Putative cation transporter protein n=1 Tax=Trypanosoma theileri TaxID=67003 RepID=A0A1X0P593_9TRYP|nr:putative cation transporter protein [Trypanosoma theileri]ORC91719.1 putative cation transporter protein [Trypanosoma theileri]